MKRLKAIGPCCDNDRRLLPKCRGARRQNPVTLHFWVAWDPPGDKPTIQPRKEIADYEKSHPGITIDVQNITYDALHSKLLTALAGGDAPDLSWGLPEWLGELSRMGALRDLTEDAKTWQDEREIYPNVLVQRAVDRWTSAGHAALSRHSRAARS